MVVVEVIPYKSFKDKLRVTKTAKEIIKTGKGAKGRITVEKDYIMVERCEYGKSAY